MIKSYKNFYSFVESLSPEIIETWNNFNNYPNNMDGTKWILKDDNSVWNFKKVIFDSNFKNGVKFFYVFTSENNKDIEFVVESINSVEDNSKLTEEDRKYLYGFFIKMKPYENY